MCPWAVVATNKAENWNISASAATLMVSLFSLVRMTRNIRSVRNIRKDRDGTIMARSYGVASNADGSSFFRSPFIKSIERELILLAVTACLTTLPGASRWASMQLRTARRNEHVDLSLSLDHTSPPFVKFSWHRSILQKRTREMISVTTRPRVKHYGVEHMLIALRTLLPRSSVMKVVASSRRRTKP